MSRSNSNDRLQFGVQVRVTFFLKTKKKEKQVRSLIILPMTLL